MSWRQEDGCKGLVYEKPRVWEEEEAPEAPVNMVGGGSDVDEDLPEESLLARDPQTGQLVCGDSRKDLGRNMRTHTPTLINSETPLMSMALGGVGSGHDPYRQACLPSSSISLQGIPPQFGGNIMQFVFPPPPSEGQLLM